MEGREKCAYKKKSVAIFLVELNMGRIQACAVEDYCISLTSENIQSAMEHNDLTKMGDFHEMYP